MSIQQWNERYRAGEQLFEEPSPLVMQYSRDLKPARALDLACGPGRNSLYLAGQGWRVQAVDGSALAIEILRRRAAERRLAIDAQVADLERGEYAIEPEAYGLICDCYYLQRSLIPKMQAGVAPGGIVIAIVHLADTDQPQATPTCARPGELRAFFEDWKILHEYEGSSREACHQRPVAELAAQKPAR
ncbi:MAG TPA: methyltransferase domain-containing protein [Bryobacteraceae bacterium]|nr:methyltransferase domain-containing protein [Bryobacteraceae bacterium]